MGASDRMWNMAALLLMYTVTLATTGCGGTAGRSTLRFERSLCSEAIDRQTLLEGNTEAYDYVPENDFVQALSQPQSTFAIDVDTAAYANVRRLLKSGQKPPKGAIRLEELVNYFTYEYPDPVDEHPLAVRLNVADCPWNSEHQLVRVALKGKSVNNDVRPAANLVFLIDVSGSMQDANKLPLVQAAFKLLVKQLREDDQIAIVVYAGRSGVALPSTSAAGSAKILSAVEDLAAGGSTNGAAGIKEAYRIAEENFKSDGINRVILCTDGDFNVGVTDQSELVDLITDKAASNVFLTVLGFGSGNLQDSTMEKLADHGNGNYAYIDSLQEARKVLVRQLGANLQTIAKDVKIQVDFNPQLVAEYRLLGYENRVMDNQDFRQDDKDAGELGAGHTVTAFYEIQPVNRSRRELAQAAPRSSEFVTAELTDDTHTLLTVNLRYKLPTESIATEFQSRLSREEMTESADRDFQFASAVVAYGLMLQDSQYKGSASWDWVIKTAQNNLGRDQEKLRAEFVSLAKAARKLSQ